MFIDIMVATMAADRAVAIEPRDYLVPAGFQLRHCPQLPSSRMRHLLSKFSGLSQPYNWAAAVLVDEACAMAIKARNPVETGLLQIQSEMPTEPGGPLLHSGQAVRRRRCRG
ncbi:hypothetical protein [Bradyrhizobium sp. McL0616]|uniref:hypothetical protein n=1 Tax=Bradyrhizobium sp. McL0616 TaxID=3415674 RepID=UPI003CFA2E15